MRKTTAFLAALLLTGCASAPDPSPIQDDDAAFKLRGPTAIAFIPKSMADDAAASRAFEEVAGATSDCLSSAGLALKARRVDREWIKVEDGEREYPLYPPFEGKAAVYLLRPGVPPRFVGRTLDAAELGRAMSAAASAYFGVAACDAQSSLVRPLAHMSRTIRAFDGTPSASNANTM